MIIGEIGSAHNGDLLLALRLVEECAAAGVDACKFQAYTPAELVSLRGNGPVPEPWGSQGWTMRTLYERAQTPLAWFPALVDKCKEVGVPWFASVFGAESLASMEAIGCPRYKIAALDHAKRALCEAVELTGKPVIRSWPRQRRPRGDATMLWAPPGYPQPDSAFAALPAMMRRFDGLSYHGTDPMVPALAVSCGAQMVEVHVQLDDTPSELDAHSSLTVSQLRELCSARVVA